MADPSTGTGAASAATTAGAAAPSVDSWHRVCSLAELAAGGVRCADIDGRPVVLFRTKQEQSKGKEQGGCQLEDGGRLWAMDRVCYHMGGPLESGDIEDIGGRLSVTCPWHRYRITLDGGEGLYQAAPGQWRSKGTRQRVHRVKVATEEAQGAPANGSQQPSASLSVFVQLNSDPAEVASDSYNSPAAYSALQARLSKQAQPVQFNTSWTPPPPPQLPGAGLGPPGAYLRSGQVFAANRTRASGAAMGPQNPFGSSAPR